MRRFVFAVLLLLANGVASADSIAYDITPQNISDQQLKFTVRCEESGGTVSVVIVVASAAIKISQERIGHFVLWEKDPPGWNTYTATSEDKKQRILIYCEVQERNVDGALHYKFQISRDLARRVSFLFGNFSPGMPSVDEYSIALGAFLPAEK